MNEIVFKLVRFFAPDQFSKWRAHVNENAKKPIYKQHLGLFIILSRMLDILYV